MTDIPQKITRWVDVALPLPVRGLFTYRLPGEMPGSSAPGSRALVPLGRRMITGVIVGDRAAPAIEASKIRDLCALTDDAPLLPPDLMDLALWAARYYVCGPGTMITALMPPGIGQRSEMMIERVANPHGLDAAAESLRRAHDGLPGEGAIKVRRSGLTSEMVRRLEEGGLAKTFLVVFAASVKAKERLQVRLASTQETAALAALAACERAPIQRRVIEQLASSGPQGLLMTDLHDRIGNITAAVTALRGKGIVTVGKSVIRRAPVLPSPRPDAGNASPTREPTAAQAEALASIIPAIEAGRTASFLIVGVTGSGKTEIYLRAIERCLALGRSALYLVPEISLTPLLARDLAARLGSSLAILHSSLGRGERFDEWRRARSGEARVVLGPRSAILAPLERPGLIVVDEEQDGSYKQEEDPRYNARDLALLRAKQAGGVALLGSATPSVESYKAALSGGLSLLTLPGRIGGRPMAAVRIIDMREEERRLGRQELVSAPLRDAVDRCLDRKEQAILLLNRRGYAPFIQCRACGASEMCRQCSVTLTYHRADNRVLCHYCGYHRGKPKSCSICGSTKISLSGAGTEKLEEYLRGIFPKAKLARLDRDTARGRRAPAEILSAFEKGEFNLLAGTQMVAKGHDFPRVTVVGVLGADGILSMPDYRAAERAFQLVTQVAGRAGRGVDPGEVLVQAYHTDHYAMQSACRQDYNEFYEKEIRFRRLMKYPPFVVMANVIISAESHEAGVRRATRAGEIIADVLGPQMQMIGPAVAPLARLKGRHRFQILIKAGARRALSDMLHEAALRLAAEKLGSPKDLAIDLDPVTLA